MYLDARSGKVLSRINQLREVNGKGLVFDPNPVVTLNDFTLEENSNISNSVYKEVILSDLNGAGFLDGPFVGTKNTKKRTKRNDNKFVFTRKERPFKEVMAYFHIDRLQRYVQELGFDNVISHSIKVDMAGRLDDNSDYSPENKSLRFGIGDVDDAEDAEIILHEYGHAILDDQVPSFGETNEAASMSEAFGDYIAASFFEGVKSSVLKSTIGTWDAVGYPGSPGLQTPFVVSEDWIVQRSILTTSHHHLIRMKMEKFGPHVCGSYVMPWGERLQIN